MHVLGDAKRHFWLAKRMADLNGVDLNTAFAQGTLDQDAWAALIESCRKCDWVEGCERYLDRGNSDGAPPERCRNGARLVAMRSNRELEKTNGDQ